MLLFTLFYIDYKCSKKYQYLVKKRGRNTQKATSFFYEILIS